MQLVKLNVIPSGTFPICGVSKGDINREITLVLVKDDSPYVLIGDEDLSLRIRRPDGIVVETEVENDGGFWIPIVIPSEATQVSGKCLCNLNIVDEFSSTGTSNFIMEVEGL